MNHNPPTHCSRPLVSRAILLLSFATIIASSCLPAVAVPIVISDDEGIVFTNATLFTPPVQFLNQDDRMLVVGFGSAADAFVDVQLTSLTYNGQQLSHAGGILGSFTNSQNNIFTGRADVYYLLNPPAFSNFSVIGTVNAANPTGFNQDAAWGMWAIALSGAAQQAPNVLFTQAQNPFAPSTTLGGTVSTTNDDSLLLGFTGLNAGLSGNRLTSNTGVTELADRSSSGLNFGAGFKHVPTAGSTPFTFTTIGFSTGIGATIIVEVESIPVLGSSQDNPILPTGGPNADGSWPFGGVSGDGGWFDPVAASGYVYATDGLSNFTDVGLPLGLGDGDGFYTISDGINLPVVVAEGGFYMFPTPIDQFTITGIDPTVDGEDPLAFPTFLAFDQSTVSFTMTPIPEPSTLSLAALALVGLLSHGRRRRA